jgi:hypothetical protein
MEKDKQSDISSAQAVILGALAPGVNVCCTIIIAVPLLHYYAIILTFFFFVVVRISGSNMEHIEISIFAVGFVSCYDACLSFLFQRLFFGNSCWVSCNNHSYPLLAS